MHLVKDTTEESIPLKYYKPFTLGWTRELRISTNPDYSVSVSYVSPNGLRVDYASELDHRLSSDLRHDNFLFEPRSISMPPFENLIPEEATENDQRLKRTINTNTPYGVNKSRDTASSRLFMKRKMFAAQSTVNGGDPVKSSSISIININKRPSEDNLDEVCARKKLLVVPSQPPVQPLQIDNTEPSLLLSTPDEVSKRIFPDRPERCPTMLRRSLTCQSMEKRFQDVTTSQKVVRPCLVQNPMNPSSQPQSDARSRQLGSFNVDAKSLWAVGESVDDWRKLDGPIVVSGDKLKRLVERSITDVPFERNSVEVTDPSRNVNMPSQFPPSCSTSCVLFIDEPLAVRTPGKACISCGLMYHSKCAVHWWQQLSIKNSVILYSEKWKQVKRKQCPTCFTKLAENIMKDVLHGVSRRNVGTRISLTYENPFSESLKKSLPNGKFWLVASTRLFPPEVVGIGDFRLSDRLAIEYQAYRIRLPYEPMFDMFRNPQPLVLVHGERVFHLTSKELIYENDVVSVELKSVVRICSRRQQVVIYSPTVEVPVSVTPSPSAATTDFLQIPTVDPASDSEKADSNYADCQVITSDEEPDKGADDVIEIEADETAECIEIPIIVEEPREPSDVEEENEEEVSCLETDDLDTKDTEKLQLIRNLDQNRRTSGEAQIRPNGTERRVTHLGGSEGGAADAHGNGSRSSEDVSVDLNPLAVHLGDAPKSEDVEDDDGSVENVEDEEAKQRQGKGNSESDFELDTYPDSAASELLISDDDVEVVSAESLEVVSTESMDVESVGMDGVSGEGIREEAVLHGDEVEELHEDAANSVTTESSTSPWVDGCHNQLLSKDIPLLNKDIKPVKQIKTRKLQIFCINDSINLQTFDSIFSLLDTPSLLRCRSVCRQWKRIIDSSPQLCGGCYHARPGYSLTLYDESALLLWLLQKEVRSVDLRNLAVSSLAVVNNLLIMLQKLTCSVPFRFYLEELAVKSCSRDAFERLKCALPQLQFTCEDIVESQTENSVHSRIGDCQDSQQLKEC